jgi:hypothetical protein
MTEQVSNGLEAAEQRRQRLRAFMDRLEAALAEPPGQDPDAWRDRLSQLVDQLDDELRSHVEGTEGPGGLFEEVMTAAPRLSTQVERVRGEHSMLRDRATLLRAVIEGDDTVEAIRTAGLDVLTALIIHRQHGADLLYETYWVDVGGLSG